MSQLPSSAPSGESKESHVHPFVAWTAVVNFALIFSLAPSVILAQGVSPEMSQGSSAVAMRVGADTYANQAKRVAEASEPSMGAKAMNTLKRVVYPEDPCQRACRTTRKTCGRENSGDIPAIHACFENFHACVSSCKEESKTDQEEITEARAEYLAAVEVAGKAKIEAMKKANADYTAAVKAAKAAYDAAVADAQ